MTRYNASNWVNTSEAYSLNAFAGPKGVVVPYINLNLMPGNSVNGIQSVVDYSYYLLLGVAGIWVNGRNECSTDHISTDIIEHIGIGGYLGRTEVEAEIWCQETRLFLPDTALFKIPPLDLFVPHDTPYFRRNLDKARVEKFFMLENLPREILLEIGGSIDKIYS